MLRLFSSVILITPAQQSSYLFVHENAFDRMQITVLQTGFVVRLERFSKILKNLKVPAACKLYSSFSLIEF